MKKETENIGASNKPKKAKNQEKVPFYKKSSFRYSTLSSVIILVFIVCLVAVNVLASFLSARFTSFNIDMTSSSDYSISDKNKEYIKKVNKPVTIVIAATEDFYSNDYSTYLQRYYNYYDTTNGKYFLQTVALLKNYNKINSDIDVKFVDPNTPDFSKYQQKYQDSSLDYGSIIVDCTYKNAQNKEKTKYKVLGVDDLYTIQSSDDSTTASTSSSAAYSITGSSVETQITSALFYVIKEQTDKIAVITGYGCTDMTTYIDNLELSGYEYETISDLSVDNIPKDATMVMLAAPTMDLSRADIKKLDNFLLGNTKDEDNNKYGKNLIYFASSAQYDTPVIDEYLEQWGLKFTEGTVYETDDGKHLSTSNSAVIMEDAGSDFTKELNSQYAFCTDNIRPMTLKFESSGNYFTNNILKTSDTCVVKPRKTAESWSASKENTSSYSTVALSRFTTESKEEKNAANYSNVLAISSVDFLNSTYTSASTLGNDELMLSLFNTCSGREVETYSIDDKQIDYSTFSPTATQSQVIMLVCGVVIPVIVLIVGIVLYVRRKRR